MLQSHDREIVTVVMLAKVPLSVTAKSSVAINSGTRGISDQVVDDKLVCDEVVAASNFTESKRETPSAPIVTP
jgi:hypothetical protein